MNRAGMLPKNNGFYIIGQDVTSIKGNCVITKEPIEFFISTKPFEEWISGNKYIQNAFPDLEPWKREFLISGVGKEGWDKIFQEDKDQY